MEAIIRALEEAVEAEANVTLFMTGGQHPRGRVAAVRHDHGVVEIENDYAHKATTIIRLDRIDAVILH
ncbi:hypothetical protein SEA_VANLEE_153 [Gordonia phage VanLee]|uniref:Uncharacterized protein n=1 Tax=Gordonia phage VanLee TaxID=2845816 RepID=A0A8F2DAE4_9CAUD|nr:hypothetical protein QEH49_gp137 [Gordonia phage VanLee]QWS68269.1 hypothetical protein SEA_VANLEE_153 [Gordonia phage VanLee]